MEPPDCRTCEKPEMLPANQGAWETFWAVVDFLVDDFGGVHLENARLAALAQGQKWDGALLAKISLLIRLILKKQEIPEEDENE